MFNITGHLYLMIFDFPLLNSLHFEYDLLFCVFNGSVFMPHMSFQLGLLGSFKFVIALTAFVIEICVML